MVSFFMNDKLSGIMRLAFIPPYVVDVNNRGSITFIFLSTLTNSSSTTAGKFCIFNLSF